MTLPNARILTDRDPIDLPEEMISGEGYITTTARIARTGIQAYYGHELAGVDGDLEPYKIYQVYRSDDEVFADEALASFRDLPITLGHPPEEVSANTYKDTAIGHVIGAPVRDGHFLKAELTIRDARAITKIRTGEAVQLSVGYHAEILLESGVTPDGQSYDAVQTQIRANHIALVDAARCGPDCRIETQLGDKAICGCASCQAKNTQTNRNEIMSDLVTLDGEQITLAQAVEKLKDANSRMAEALRDAEATIESLSADLETKSGEVEALAQKSGAVSTGDSAFADRVQARAKILSDARQILGEGSMLSDLADADIQRKVINHVYGDSFASGASKHAISGMYKVALRDALKSADTLNGRIAPTHRNSELKQAAARRIQRLSMAWQKGA